MKSGMTIVAVTTACSLTARLDGRSADAQLPYVLPTLSAL
jgi:hypothetical protein